MQLPVRRFQGNASTLKSLDCRPFLAASTLLRVSAEARARNFKYACCCWYPGILLRALRSKPLRSYAMAASGGAILLAALGSKPALRSKPLRSFPVAASGGTTVGAAVVLSVIGTARACGATTTAQTTAMRPTMRVLVIANMVPPICGDRSHTID
jgi:hypothetical protein